MGSVIDEIECPNCGLDAYSDYYYKTGEEYINCQNCGYHRSATIINRDKALNELTDEDWEVHELKNPYGAYRLRILGDIGTHCGSVESEEAFEDIKKAVAQMENVEYFSLNRLIGNEIISEVIYETGQESDSNRDTDQQDV
jgi:Zn ribbon nucleic-acid-binding protein